MPTQTDLAEWILEYGTRIIKVVESLPKTLVGRRIGDQLLCRSVSGSNFKEAQAAESSASFAHKVQIALKELGETNYCLRVIAKANTPPSSRLALLIDESHQLVAMLSKTVARAKVKAKD